MTKETKAERIARLAVEKVDAEIAATAKLAVYKKSLPKRMMEAQALAKTVGIEADVSMIESGPEITFRFPYSAGDGAYGTQINYQTEEWEMENLESVLQERKEEYDAKTSRKALAQVVWSKLTPAEQAALKEHIHWMR